METVDARKKVEAIFAKCIPDEEGCLGRSDFMEMLKFLGLRRIDAKQLLAVLDPQCQDRLSYKVFLDFIFGMDARQLGKEEKDNALDDLDEMENKPPGLSDQTSEGSPTTKQMSSQIFSSEGETMTPEAVSPTPDAGTPSHDGSGAASPADITIDSGEISTVDQCSQCLVRGEVFQDPSDLEMYCERCWKEYYGKSPHEILDMCGGVPGKLVTVTRTKVWKQSDLMRKWRETPIPGWPPYASPTPPVKDAKPVACPPSGDPRDIPQHPGQSWVDVRVRVVPNLIGPHARECTRQDRPYLREVLGGRYQVDGICGAGHFTRAFKATDLVTKQPVCVKRHNSLTVEVLTDLMAIGLRLQAVDPASEFFPRLLDQFFDMNGYTVEAMLQGKNCKDLGLENPRFFQKMTNLRHVANGSLKGLQLLSLAGIVHTDLKPDNIMWTDSSTSGEDPLVRIVDFGCARLDSRHESGRNWSLSEGGAGHLGKWAPEMALRLPITDKADVWGLAVSLLELYSGRQMWSNESDTIEIILAQAIGLLDARDGLPMGLMRRSPVDITRLYSPPPAFFPCRRLGDMSDSLEEMRPAVWGLGQVLGHRNNWDEEKTNLADLVLKAMEMDPEKRASASTLLKHAFIVGSSDEPKESEPKEPEPMGID